MKEEHETGAYHVIERAHRFLAEKSRQGLIPPVLQIQADNCTRENKNKYVLGYFELLVAMGVVEEVLLSFLPVGYTHEDIDQVLSRTSVHLRTAETLTLNSLACELRRSFSPQPSVSRMSEIVSFSRLCLLSKCLYERNAWTHNRYFRITRASRDPRGALAVFNTTCTLKVNSMDEWMSFRDGRGFLKVCPKLEETPPTKIDSPTNFEEVNKCFSTCEARIADARVMGELRELRHSVYRSRSEACHWDISTFIESNGQYKSEHERNAEKEDEVFRDLVDFDYEY